MVKNTKQKVALIYGWFVSKCVQEARQCSENVDIADEKSILHSAALSLDQSFILAFSNIDNTILEWSRALEGGTLVGWFKD